MTVFDASALLAYLQGETGADEVERRLDAASVCGAANWSEVAQKVMRAGGDWPIARALLRAQGVSVAAVTEKDAETAAALWRTGEALSLGDRLCLALGERLGTEIVTADRAWAPRTGVIVIRK